MQTAGSGRLRVSAPVGTRTLVSRTDRTFSSSWSARSRFSSSPEAGRITQRPSRRTYLCRAHSALPGCSTWGASSPVISPPKNSRVRRASRQSPSRQRSRQAGTLRSPRRCGRGRASSGASDALSCRSAHVTRRHEDERRLERAADRWNAAPGAPVGQPALADSMRASVAASCSKAGAI